MRSPVLIALIAIFAIVTSVAPVEQTTATENANRHWQTIAKLNFPVETRTAFRETRSSKLLRKPVQQTGTLWIETGGDFVMQVLEPRKEERRVSEGRLQLTRGLRQRSVVLDPNKGAHQLLLSIVAVLEGNIEQLQGGFEINALEANNSGIADDWSVALTPTDPTLRKTLQRLVLRGQANSLRSLRAERSTSRWQEIRIQPPVPSNLEPNTSD